MVSYLESFLRRTNCAATPVLASMIAALFLAACEHQNEGVVSTAHLTANTKAQATQDYDKRYFRPSEIDALHLVNKGDAYSISIISIFVCNFHEIGWLDLTLSANSSASCDNGSGDAGGSPNTRGEIVLIANVVEGPIGEDDPSAGRVVFYSSDVRESGQTVNDKPISIQGTQFYDGTGLNMSLAMLELDNQENEAAKSMMQTLASVGTAAYPPSSAALGALSKLGDSLLSGNQDDTEFWRRITFDPPRTTSSDNGTSVYRNPLAEGYIAFMRSEDRSADLRFDADERGWTICPRQGEIMVGNCNEGKIYRERSWVLVRISKEDKGTATNLEARETLAQLQERLSNSAKAGVDMTKIVAKISEVATEVLNAEVANIKENLEAGAKATPPAR
ncbi:MAG: hypothetical protein NXH87_09300 [Rhodobiaceae bacterium]|nr:hypothetical protein [Rhodobiaceae bacterium]